MSDVGIPQPATSTYLTGETIEAWAGDAAPATLPHETWETLQVALDLSTLEHEAN